MSDLTRRLQRLALIITPTTRPCGPPAATDKTLRYTGVMIEAQRFHLWPALAGLSLALGTGLTALDAGAHSVPPAAALTLTLSGLPGSIDRLASAAQPLDAAAPDLLAGLLPTPTLQKAAPAPVADPAATARIQQGYGRLPMHFEPNQGQTAAEVRYLARGAGYSLFLTDTEAVLVLRKAAGPAAIRPEAGPIAPRSFQRAIAPFSFQGAGTPFSLQGASVGMPSWPWMIPESMRDAVGAGFKPAPTPEPGSRSETGPPQAAVVRMRLTGPTHNPAPAVAGLELQPGISNYILGNDPAKWRSGVPHYARVQYDQVYP